ncbi:MAG: DNA-directed RNA polymerase subunit RPC12/RpoP [Flavobacteriales bacterium]|jgi:DNA-directed RNA polymerase subunit RPC12/RpoP
MAEVEKLAEGAHKIHCSNCGSELKYKPGTEVLDCQYCGTQNEISASDVVIEEKDLDEYLRLEAGRKGSDAVETLECGSCGAINPFEETNVGKACMFCGGHLLAKDAVKIDQIKPQALIPFQIEHRKAILHYSTWLKSRWFAPNDLKHMQNLPDKIRGIYMPYWTFDAQTESDYSGQRGVNRTEYESYSVEVNGETQTKQRSKTVTDWYSASGHVSHFFDDELTLGNNAVPELISMKLRPWDLSLLVPFDHDFLRGFIVESYSIGLEESFGTAKERIETQVNRLVRSDIGGDQQRIHSVDTDWHNLTFKHILLPMYVSAYQFKGKSFRFLINGQTGEVQGERPYSVWKIASLVISILAVIGLILFFAQQ